MADLSDDKKFMEVLTSMVAEYVGGQPWAVMGFDIMRISGEVPSMEKVFIMLMSEADYKTMSLMIKVLHYPGVKERVFDAVMKELDAIKQERDSGRTD